MAITVTGGRWPVHYVSVELVGDGQPAAYWWAEDARAVSSYPFLPLPRSGRFTYTVQVVDEFGCAASTVGAVTVEPS